MGLLTAGYWPSTYWAKDYWHDGYWQDYGLIAVDSTGASKAVRSAYFPVAVHQSGGQGKAVHYAGTITKGVKR